SIVLFDEIEKAHSDVFNILLQILDDGRITDSGGRMVDFKNTIIIMTSNLGSEYILENNKDSEILIMKELKNTFRPEFLNRIDEIVIFNSLDKNIIIKILDKLILEIEERLSNLNIHIKLTNKAKNFIIENGYDSIYGARPLKRYLSHNLETLLARELLEGNIKNNNNLLVDIKNNKLIIKNEE
ncbi:MAG: AAA family ATPase, partial [Bacilli bacterium]